MITNILKGFDIQNKLQYLFFKDQTDTQKAGFCEWIAKRKTNNCKGSKFRETSDRNDHQHPDLFRNDTLSIYFDLF